MIHPRKRWYITLSILALTPLASYWLGSHNTQVAPIEDLLMAAPGFVVLPFVLWRIHWSLALLAPPLIVAMTISVWILGAKERSHAINDCVERCVNVQRELEAYRAKHGHYPAGLGEMNTCLPGRMLLPPQIVEYRRTAEGYDLWIADGMMSYQGTQAIEFFVHK